MPPRKPAKKVTVPNAELMDQQTLRNHIQARHRTLGFWGRNEHTQDHRLFPERVDHIHQGTEEIDEPDV